MIAKEIATGVAAVVTAFTELEQQQFEHTNRSRLTPVARQESDRDRESRSVAMRSPSTAGQRELAGTALGVVKRFAYGRFHGQIEWLVAEEHGLREVGRAATRRLATASACELKVSLDRMWDVLRERRALRDAERDPDDADLRFADTVEGYEQ